MQVAGLLCCDQEEILFTGSGTESNNLAIRGFLAARDPVAGDHLIISAIEHPAVTQPVLHLQQNGYEVTIVPCSADGIVDPDDVLRAIRPETILVSIMQANNEIGTIQPIREIATVCKERGVVVHTDAAQTVGKIPVSVDELGVDLLTIAGHKLYGPKGVGALFVREGVVLDPVMFGADHEMGLRPGTENVPGIVGLGAACALAAKGIDETGERLMRLRDLLADRLNEALGIELPIHGKRAPRLPNTLSIVFPGVPGHELLAQTPEICASTGSACHAGAAAMSPVLAALGLNATDAVGTVRLSVGWYTSEDDIQRAAGLLAETWESLRGARSA